MEYIVWLELFDGGRVVIQTGLTRSEAAAYAARAKRLNMDEIIVHYHQRNQFDAAA